jgi:hypothetical protein
LKEPEKLHPKVRESLKKPGLDVDVLPVVRTSVTQFEAISTFNTICM